MSKQSVDLERIEGSGCTERKSVDHLAKLEREPQKGRSWGRRDCAVTHVVSHAPIANETKVMDDKCGSRFCAGAGRSCKDGYESCCASDEVISIEIGAAS